MNERKFEIAYVSDGKSVSLASYETLKAFTLERCDAYRRECPPAIADDIQLKEAKERRAALNRTAKAINDRKILEIKELTGAFTEQVKEICDLIKGTAGLYDDAIKRYEGKTPKEAKTAYTIIPADEETSRKLERYLSRNKIEYSKKEGN